MKPSHLLSWIIQLGTAAVLVMAGLMKLTGRTETVLLFQKLDFDPGGRMVVGVLEILAALLLIIPQSVIWGAVLAWGIMSGALIAHFTRLGFSGDFGQLGFMAIAIWIGSALVVVLRRHQSRSIRRMFASRGADHETGTSDEP